ncbi:MAG TPA: hypothetical protein VFI69_00875 [Candidatus Limnocylindrales bacterium]|jgi:hypothetical protein|nr:hypothetical protein [Candidatus Limnocylindrales bacterium]
MTFADIFLAADLIAERRRDARRDALAVRAAQASRAGSSPSGSPLRHLTAVGLAGLSRASAAAVRRLDSCIADELTAGMTARPQA